MSLNNEKKLSLEVRRIRGNVRAGFIEDYGSCSPRSLIFNPRAEDAEVVDAAAEKPVAGK